MRNMHQDATKCAQLETLQDAANSSEPATIRQSDGRLQTN
eukprot:gene24256-biopygen17904